MKKNKTHHAAGRRKFLKGAALTASAFMIVPRHVLGKGFIAPSDKLNVAGIGVGGMGAANLRNLAPTENIVALCDVDDAYAAKTYETYPNAKRYKDYRIMLEQQKDIDGVVIATPDHLHAVQAIAAMKAGKHVYVQKPLTYTIEEARTLARLAKEMPKIVTQMGNQGHSSDDARLINEIIAADMIGKVTEVHVWTNRPIWPQGIDFPKDTPPTPPTLDWDLFLGPAQPRTYNPAYHPFKWRGWVDYGVGALGDMGAHLIDHAVWSLNLGAPTNVEASSSRFNGESYPTASIVYYDFAARGKMPAVRMTWYDGGLLPERPKELLPEEKIDKGGGVLYIGSKGKLMHGTYGSKPQLLPTTLMKDFKAPKQLFPRVGMSHERNWAEACKGNGKANCSFDYAGPLTETMILGVLALRSPGMKLTWDAANMQFTNAADLNQYVKRNYRTGYSLT